jgi:hypothetical protein
MHMCLSFSPSPHRPLLMLFFNLLSSLETLIRLYQLLKDPDAWFIILLFSILSFLHPDSFFLQESGLSVSGVQVECCSLGRSK